jgi:pyruvate-ferredoxin/flavodoxin oxidoreductase
VADKLGWDAERRASVDKEFAVVYSVLAEFPLAKTTPFFDLPENQEKGTGGLLSITVNPEACKGCNLCVEVCPDNALITVHQTEEIVDRLRRNWKLWERLPDTNDRYINISDLEGGIGILPTLLLKKGNYRPWRVGMGPAWDAARRPRSTSSSPPSKGSCSPGWRSSSRSWTPSLPGLEQKIRDLLTADADLDWNLVEGGRRTSRWIRRRKASSGATTSP